MSKRLVGLMPPVWLPLPHDSQIWCRCHFPFTDNARSSGSMLVLHVCSCLWSRPLNHPLWCAWNSPFMTWIVYAVPSSDPILIVFRYPVPSRFGPILMEWTYRQVLQQSDLLYSIMVISRVSAQILVQWYFVITVFIGCTNIGLVLHIFEGLVHLTTTDDKDVYIYT